MSRRLYPKWHEDALTMFKAGRSQIDIADKHGVSRERVRQILVSYGGHKSRPASGISDKVIALYDSGKCVDEIARAVKKGFSCITRILRREGVKVDPLRRREKFFNAVVLAKQGKTVSEIAKELKMSIGVASYVLDKYLPKRDFRVILEKGEKIRAGHWAEKRRKEKADA